MTTFATYLRDARERAGLSLREAARLLGVSHVFLGEVERGMRALPPARWQAVCEVLPVTMEKLTELERMRRPVRIDLSNKTPEVQRLGLAFARRIESGLTEEQLQALKGLLGNEEDE